MRKFLCCDETAARLSVDGSVLGRYRNVSIESWDRRGDGDARTGETRARAAGRLAAGQLVPYWSDVRHREYAAAMHDAGQVVCIARA